MEPLTILIYLAIIFLIILGIQCIIAMYHIIRISKKVDKISDFVDGLFDIFKTIESIPGEIIKLIAKRFFK